MYARAKRLWMIGLILAVIAPSTRAQTVENPTTDLSLRFGEPTGAELPVVDSNDPTAIDAQQNLWFIQAVGGTIASTPWRIHKGTTMDNLVHQYDYVPDRHWPRPHGDDTWWAEGPWIDPATGTWYVVMHTEFNYNKYSRVPGTGYSLDRMGTVSLATSTDEGKSWSYQGEIIGSDHSVEPAFWANHNFYDGGQGDPSLFVDKDHF